MARAREHLQKCPDSRGCYRLSGRASGTGIRRDVCRPSKLNWRAITLESRSIQSIEARFGVVQGTPLKPWQMQTDLGYRYKTETEIAQFRVDGFTFSKIAPYTTWGEVSSEALRLWKVYVEVAKPRQVSRVAVRYINRMRLPNVKDLGEYLEAPPQVACTDPPNGSRIPDDGYMSAMTNGMLRPSSCRRLSHESIQMRFPCCWILMPFVRLANHQTNLACSQSSKA